MALGEPVVVSIVLPSGAPLLESVELAASEDVAVLLQQVEQASGPLLAIATRQGIILECGSKLGDYGLEHGDVLTAVARSEFMTESFELVYRTSMSGGASISICQDNGQFREKHLSQGGPVQKCSGAQLLDMLESEVYGKALGQDQRSEELRSLLRSAPDASFFEWESEDLFSVYSMEALVSGHWLHMEKRSRPAAPSDPPCAQFWTPPYGNAIMQNASFQRRCGRCGRAHGIPRDQATKDQIDAAKPKGLSANCRATLTKAGHFMQQRLNRCRS